MGNGTAGSREPARRHRRGYYFGTAGAATLPTKWDVNQTWVGLSSGPTNSPTDQTVRNPQYNADGTLVQTRLTPQNAGFGAVTAAQAMRSVQLQLRFQF